MVPLEVLERDKRLTNEFLRSQNLQVLSLARLGFGQNQWQVKRWREKERGARDGKNSQSRRENEIKTEQ